MKSKNRHKGHKNKNKHKNKHKNNKKHRLPDTLGSGHMSKRALAARTDELNRRLFESIEEGKLSQVKRAIKDGADVTTLNEDGFTPLMLASLMDRHEVVQELVYHNPELVTARDRGERTALMFAINCDHVNVIEALLFSPVDQVNLADSDGETALIRAARADKADLVKLLIAKGADVNLKNNEDKGPLDHARWGGSADILREAGATLSKREGPRSRYGLY